MKVYYERGWPDVADTDVRGPVELDELVRMIHDHTGEPIEEIREALDPETGCGCCYYYCCGDSWTIVTADDVHARAEGLLALSERMREGEEA